MQITRLRTKLLSAFITIAFGAALMGLFGIRGMSLTADSLHEVTADQIPNIIKLGEVQNHFTWMLRFTQNAMVESLAGDKARVAVAKARMEQERRRFEEGFASYDGQQKHGDEGVAWSAVVAAYKAWQPHIDACWAGIDSGDTKRALDALRATVPFSNAVGEALRATMQAERAESEVWAAQAMASAARARLWTWVILFGTLAGALGLGWLVTLSITRPVERMTEAAARISEGDVDQRIEHQGADEVGRLADSFRKLVAYIRDVAQAADALGTGDLKRDIEPRSQTDTLGHSMARARDSLRSLVRESQSLISAAQGGALAHRADTGGFTGAYGALIAGMNGVLEAVKKPVDEAQRVLDRVAAGDLTARTSGAFTGDYARLMGALDTSTESLRQSLAHVATSAGQVADATRQIASSSQAVAQGASEQASALEETSAELIELSGATKRNASSAERADELARSAEGASSVGRDAMGRMSEAMQKIRASAEGTAAIIRDINEIAFQTNLLALNAAVEAARAGESGRGFAVVADEVRALALRSKEAAKRTEALIGESMALSQQGEDISRHVGSALSEIAGGVTAVAGIVAEIKDASVTQARGIEQINHALAQVDQATQAAAASAEEASSASEELAAQATELSSLVGKFDVHEPSKAPAKAVSAPRARSTIPSARAPVFHA